MGLLDRHIAAVRRRLWMQGFVHALAWTLIMAAGGVLAGLLVYKFTQWAPPQPMWWVYAAAVMAVVAAAVVAGVRGPGKHEAAVAIDLELGLKEKFSTALFVRHSDDPFARAAVRDAENAAASVNPHRRFPLRFPSTGYYSALMILAALLATLLPTFDLLGTQQTAQRQQLEQERQDQARRHVEQALARIEAAPKLVAETEAVKQARAELLELLRTPPAAPEQAQRTAAKALSDLDEALRQQVQSHQRYAQAKNDQRLFRQMQPPPQQQGPVADAHRNLSRGDFSGAIEELNKAVESFNQMDERQKEQAAQQMRQLAQALEQMARNPQVQQQMQQQLQKLGADPQQAEQMQQLMQQAAQGNAQAAQQLQQQARQLMQQMNNGQGPTAQQQQVIEQMMQQMQAQANAQQTAQQMAQAAQQMAQCMGGQAGQQGMAQAMQQMQDMLAQMEAAAQDAQQLAAAQRGMGAAQDGPGQDPQGAPGQGQWAPGDPRQIAQGMGGPGIGQGGQAAKAQAPFGVKQEASRSHDDERGRFLAKFLVKDSQPLPGEARQQLREVAEAGVSDQPDEVDTDRVSRQAREAVKRYFGSMSEGD